MSTCIGLKKMGFVVGRRVHLQFMCALTVTWLVAFMEPASAEFVPPAGQVTVSDLKVIERAGASYYAAGEAGTMLFSADGRSWEVIESSTTRSFSTSAVFSDNVIMGASWVDVFGFTTVPQGLDLVYFEPGNDSLSLKKASGLTGRYNSLTRFVVSNTGITGFAIAESGPGGRTIARISSTDGVNWNETILTSSGGFFNHIQFFKDTFYAVDMSRGMIVKSADGLSWQDAAALAGGSQSDWVTVLGVIGERLVAAGKNGRLHYTVDGQSWTSGRVDIQGIINISAIAEEKGLIVVAGENGRIATSRDMKTWLDVTPPWSHLNWHDIAAGPDGFVVVGESGAIAMSSQGSEWDAVSYPTLNKVSHLVESTGPLSFMIDNGQYAEFQRGLKTGMGELSLPFAPSAVFRDGSTWVLGSNDGEIAVSTDGLDWQIYTHPSGAIVSKIIAVSDSFVAITAGGHILQSADGLEWASVSQIPLLEDICYADGTFHAIARKQGYPSMAFYKSGDLRSWQAAALSGFDSNTEKLTGITAGRGIVVASSVSRSVSSKGHLGYPSIYYSKDGGMTFDHVQITQHNVALRGVLFDGDRFVAYGSHGVMKVSRDGETWTSGPADQLVIQDYVSGMATDAGVLLLTSRGQVLASPDEEYFEGLPNLAPSASDDEVTVNSGDYIYIPVLENDSDPDGDLDPLSIEIISPPSGGGLVVNPGEPVTVGSVKTVVPEGVIVYQNTALMQGFDSFTYRVADAEGLYSGTVTVRININEPPSVVFHNPVDSMVMDADSSDWGDDQSVGMDPRDATAADDELDWRNMYVAHDRHFLYLAYDSYLPISLSWAHNIFIDCDEDESTGLEYAGLGVDVLVQQGRVYQYVGDGSSWEWLNLFSANQAASSAFVEIAVPRIALGQNDRIRLAFHASNAAYGENSTIDVFPNNSGFIRYSLSVEGGNHAPAVAAGSHALVAGGGVDFALHAVDPDGDPLTVVLLNPPSHGQLSGSFPQMRYSPDDGFTGMDSMTWKVSDGFHESVEVSEEFIVYPAPADGFFQIPVFNLTVDGDLSDWTGIPCIGEDPDDVRPRSPSLIDWRRIWMANTSRHLVIAAETFETNPLSADFNVLFDTDSDEDSGFLGHPNTRRINGADFLLQGQYLFRYTGSGHDWSWEYVAAAEHAWKGTVHEWKISLADLGDPEEVRVLLKAEINQFYHEQLPVIEISAVNDFFPDESRDRSVDSVLKYRIVRLPLQTAIHSAAGHPVDVRPLQSFRVLMQPGIPAAIAPGSMPESIREKNIELTIDSPSGMNYIIQQSHDFRQWDDVASLRLEAGQSVVVVPDDGSPACFYRAIPAQDARY